MKKFFYPRLAMTGIRKNGRTYVPYLLTCIGMIMMSYLLFFLMRSERITAMRGGEILQEMLSLGSGIFCIFSMIFLFYTNSFLIRRRKQEFGLYNILGMGKWNLARILVWESVIMAAISFAGGLVLGILFSKFAELCMAWVLEGDAGFAFSIEWGALLKTLVIFSVIFGCILLNGLRQVGRAKPIELLHGSMAGEKAPKGNWFLALAGAGLLAAAYYIAVSIENPLTAILGFFAAVLMVILATYLLFISGSVVLCRMLKKHKSYYYKANHFVSISSMMYRMKRNGAGLASICILSTMVLVMISATACLYIGKESLLKDRYPQEVQIETYSVDPENTGIVHGMVETELQKSGIAVQDLYQYRYLPFGAMLQEDQAILDQDSVGMAKIDYSALCDLFFIPLEDYNRLTGSQETLEQEEILVSCNRGGAYEYETLNLEGYGSMRVKKTVPEFLENSMMAYTITPTMIVVVSDMEVFAAVDRIQKEIFGQYASMARDYYGFDVAESDEIQSEVTGRITDQIMAWRGEDENSVPVAVSCVAEERAGFYGLFSGLFVLGILLGSVFLLATVLIMYYKQITEGYEDQSRFEVMRKVGMTGKGIRKSINSQMMTVFLLPLLAAGMHLTFAFPVIRKLLLMFGLMDTVLLIEVTVGCFLVFTVFYMLVYRMTSRAYYRIVGGEKE